MKYLLIFLLVILILTVQTGFLAGLGWGAFINLPLLLIVFASFFGEKKWAAAMVLIMGLWFDVYSSRFFGFFMAFFAIELFLIELLKYYVFRNRNLNNFLLFNLTAVLSWSLLYGLVIYGEASLSGLEVGAVITGDYFVSIGAQLATHSAIILAVYMLWPKLKRNLQAETVKIKY